LIFNNKKNQPSQNILFIYILNRVWIGLVIYREKPVKLVGFLAFFYSYPIDSYRIQRYTSEFIFLPGRGPTSLPCRLLQGRG